MLEQRLLLAGTWTTFTAPASISAMSNMMLLSDGTVMAHGSGTVNTWFSLSPNQPGTLPGLDQSYINGSWSALPSMSVQRTFFPSAVLPNGDLFVLGGEFASDQNLSISGEIFDTANHTWRSIRPYAQDQNGTNLAPIFVPIPTNPPQNYDNKVVFGDDPIAVLPDGRVLCGSPLDNQTFIYDPVTDFWSPGATKLNPDRSDEETWVKLPDGSILTYDIWYSFQTGVFQAERYVPSPNGPGQWMQANAVNSNNPPQPLYDSFIAGTPPTLQTSGELGGAVVLPNGKVFITGNNAISGVTALYDIATKKWSAGPSIPPPSASLTSIAGGDLPMCAMPDGHVLIAEYDSTQPNQPPSGTSIHLWDYDPNNASQPYTEVKPPSPFHDVNYPYMLMLPTGQVLMTDQSRTMYVYTPGGLFLSSMQTTITTITHGSRGNVFTLTGNNLNGFSEGAAYGDDAEMSSNYPIVQLIDQFGTVKYARTSNWTSTGISPIGGAVPETVQFTMPSGFAPGAYRVSVIANGVPSEVMLDVQVGTATTANVTILAHPGTPTVSLDVRSSSAVVATLSQHSHR